MDLNGVNKLADYSFADCTALKSIDLSSISSYSNCGTYTFSGCTALESVTFPSNITTINKGLFQGCTSLTDFDFSTITSIYTEAFEGAGLTGELYLLKATTLQARAFADCPNLEKVILEAYSGAEESSGYAATYTEIFTGCASLSEVSMPKATRIQSSMFADCKMLTVVSAPNATSVYNYAFMNCERLRDTTFGSITSIYGSAFENCTALASFDFSNVTSIYVYAFRNTALVEADMPKVTTLYGEAFANCTKLVSVNMPKLALGSSDYYGDPDYKGSTYYFESYVRMFKGCTALKTVSMDVNLRCAYGMFEGCTSLTTVYCPLMEKVWAHAFDGCSALTTFDFDKLTHIYAYAFKDCTSIKSATLSAFDNSGGSAYSINSTSFAGWTAEQSIFLPNFKWSKLSESFQTQWNTYCQAVTTWANEEDD